MFLSKGGDVYRQETNKLKIITPVIGERLIEGESTSTRTPSKGEKCIIDEDPVDGGSALVLSKKEKS